MMKELEDKKGEVQSLTHQLDVVTKNTPSLLRSVKHFVTN